MQVCGVAGPWLPPLHKVGGSPGRLADPWSPVLVVWTMSCTNLFSGEFFSIICLLWKLRRPQTKTIQSQAKITSGAPHSAGDDIPVPGCPPQVLFQGIRKKGWTGMVLLQLWNSVSKPQWVELVSDENSLSLEKVRKTDLWWVLEKCIKFNEIVFRMGGSHNSF